MTDPLPALARIRLTPAARSRFPDIGERDGVMLRTETGWAIVKWRGRNDETRLPVEDVEALECLLSVDTPTVMW